MTRKNIIQKKTANRKIKKENEQITKRPNDWTNERRKERRKNWASERTKAKRLLYSLFVCYFALYLWLCNNLYIYVCMVLYMYKIRKKIIRSLWPNYKTLYAVFNSIQSKARSVSHIRTICFCCCYCRHCIKSRQNKLAKR